MLFSPKSSPHWRNTITYALFPLLFLLLTLSTRLAFGDDQDNKDDPNIERTFDASNLTVGGPDTVHGPNIERPFDTTNLTVGEYEKAMKEQQEIKDYPNIERIFNDSKLTVGGPEHGPNIERPFDTTNLTKGEYEKAMKENPEIEREFDASNLTVDAYKKAAKEELYIEPKMYYYDEFGYLIVDGTVPGQSTPITLDHKVYANTCTSNVYFFFNFVTPGKEAVEAVMDAAEEAKLSQEDVAEMLSTCPYGMTFCYEGQLDGEGVREQFRVSNLLSDEDEDLDLPSTKVGLQCMLVNDVPNAHGFNMAVVAFPGLKKEDIKTAPGRTIDWTKYSIHWRFFVLTLSITREEYYFLVPDNGRVMLQIGDRKSLSTYFTDTDDNMLPPVQFEYASNANLSKQTYGTTTLGQDDLPDPYNMKQFTDHRGLWMLYLDFKRRFNELQVVSSIHSEDCNMRVEIRGNRMRKCRTYMENIAVTEPSDVEMEFIYTQEVGNIKRTEKGQEDIMEMMKKMEKETLKKTTEKTGEQNKTESSTTTKEEQMEKTTQEKHEREGVKAHVKASVKVSAQTTKVPFIGGDGPGGAAGFMSKLGGAGGNIFGGKKGIMGGILKSAQSFGSNFLQQAAQLGVFENVMGLLDNSPLGEIKKGLMETVAKGVGNLGSLSEAAKKIVGPALDKVKNLGGDIMKRGMQTLTDLGNKVTGPDGLAGLGKGILEKVQSKAVGLTQLLQKKTGIISNGLGSLLGKTMDGSTGLVGKIGEQIGKLASKGPDVLQSMTGKLQNLLPASLGGELRSIGDKFQSMTGGGIGDIVSKIPGLSEGLSKIPSALGLPGGMPGTEALGSVGQQLGKLGEKFKLPTFSDISKHLPDGLRDLPSGGKITDKLMDGLGKHGLKMPSSVNDLASGFKDKLGEITANLPTVDTLGKNLPGSEKIKEWTQKATDLVKGTDGLNAFQSYANTARSVGGSIVERGQKLIPTDINKKLESVKDGIINTVTGRRRKRAAAPDANINAELEAQAGYGSSSGSDQKSSNEKSSSKSSSERMFSDVSASKSLMESFKSTTGVTDTMSNSQFAQNSETFTSREAVDITVSGIPKNKKVVISQMMYECDGNIIKLPKVILHDGVEEIKGLSESIMSKKVPQIVGETRLSNSIGIDNNTTKRGASSRPRRSIEYSENVEIPEQSMISRFMHDGHPDNWDSLTLAEKIAIDPYFLFEGLYEEEHEKYEEVEKEIWEDW